MVKTVHIIIFLAKKYLHLCWLDIWNNNNHFTTVLFPFANHPLSFYTHVIIVCGCAERNFNRHTHRPKSGFLQYE